MTLNALLLTVGWVVAVTSAMLHGTLLPWWRTELGRYFFSWPVSITLVLSPNMTRLVFGDFYGRTLMTQITFTLMVGVLGWGLFLLVKYYVKTRRERSKDVGN